MYNILFHLSFVRFLFDSVCGNFFCCFRFSSAARCHNSSISYFCWYCLLRCVHCISALCMCMLLSVCFSFVSCLMLAFTTWYHCICIYDKRYLGYESIANTQWKFYGIQQKIVIIFVQMEYLYYFMAISFYFLGHQLKRRYAQWSEICGKQPDNASRLGRKNGAREWFVQIYAIG